MTFEEALLGWHDFYLAAAGAAAALLGLLFVGVSINLGALNAVERIDLRQRASQAFSNLTFVLVLSLSVLIPQEDARSLAIACGIMAVIGLFLMAGRLRTIGQSWNQVSHPVIALRRLSWSCVALLLLGFAAIELWSVGSVGNLYTLISVVFLLLIGAAEVSWDLLVRLSDEEAEHDQPSPGRATGGRRHSRCAQGDGPRLTGPDQGSVDGPRRSSRKRSPARGGQSSRPGLPGPLPDSW